MIEFPIIELTDIVLRELRLEDYENYFDYVTDNAIAKHFLFDYNSETAKNRLEELTEKYKTEQKPFVWAIALKTNNELIGIISIDSISFKNKNFSIAYGIREKYRNNGYAYQASYGLIDYIFKNFDMHRLQLGHNSDNIASQKIIEKLGAVLEGIARESKFYDNSFKDRKVYSILKSEWNKITEDQ